MHHTLLLRVRIVTRASWVSVQLTGLSTKREVLTYMTVYEVYIVPMHMYIYTYSVCYVTLVAQGAIKDAARP